jgi:membrane protease YdiL (CAAX protease family)
MLRVPLFIIVIFLVCGVLPAETNVSATGSYHSAETHTYTPGRDYSGLSLWQLYQEAQNNNPDAQYYYARRLEQKAAQTDMSRSAMKWFRTAAANGSTQAQIVMMQRCFLGVGVSNDSEKAVWYGKQVLNNPGTSAHDRGTVSVFLAGTAFGRGKMQEGCRYLLNTIQSPVLAAEYAVLFLLLLIVTLYMHRQYRLSHRPGEQQYVWTLMDCLAAFLLLAAGTLFWEFILILLVIPVLHMPYLLSAMVLSNIAILCAILYCILLARWRGASLADVFRLKWIAWYKYPAWVFLGMWAILILRVLYMAASVVLDIPTRIQPVQHMLMQESSVAVLIPVMIDGVIIAAVFEEFLFRGVVHRVLRAWLPAWAIVAISAAIFGAVHLDPWNFMPLALTGLVLAASYEMTRSLTIPILLHAANNLLSFVLVLLVRYLPGM